MAIREQIKEGAQALQQGEKSVLLRSLELGIHLLLGAVLAGTRVFGHCAPFGVAAVAATGGSLRGLFTLMGSLFGYLYIHGVTEGLHYGAAVVLTFATTLALHGLRVTQRREFSAVLAAGVCAVTSFLRIQRLGFAPGDVIFYVTEIFLVAAATLCYRNVFEAGINETVQLELQTPEQKAGALAIALTCFAALSGVMLMGEFSLGRILAAVAVMETARHGSKKGFSAGTIVGLALDAASGRGPYYCMVYAVAGGASGLCWSRSRVVTALSYIAAGGAAVLWTWESGMRIGLLYEVFVASVIYLLIPQRVWRKLSQLISLPQQETERWQGARLAVAQRMQRTGKAFRAVYESLWETLRERPEEALDDPSVVFHRAAERQCCSCSKRELCWQQAYQDTQRDLNDATKNIMERGRAEEEDFPETFRTRCKAFSAFAQTVSEEVTAFLYRKQYQGRMRDSRTAVCQQYAQIDRLLGNAAAEISAEITPDLPREARLNSFLRGRNIEQTASVYYDESGRLRVETPPGDLFSGKEGREKLSGILGTRLKEGGCDENGRLFFHQAEPFRAVAGVAGQSKKGQQVSGDTGTWFRREDGLLCILLCDGMGSGTEARRESSLAVRLLENFLRAGVEPEAALETVNAALTLRGDVSGCTTVDLLTVELYTGLCTIYKFGAASSYLRKGEKISCIQGSGLPAGIAAGEAKPDVSHFRGRQGDWVVLLSDGVIGGEEDQWLRQSLSDYGGSSPGELAQQILNESRARSAASDDSTVIVVRLEQKMALPDA